MKPTVAYCLFILKLMILMLPLALHAQTPTDSGAYKELIENRLIKTLDEVVIAVPSPSTHNDSVYLALKQKMEKKNFFVRKLARLLTPNCTMDEVKKNDFESSEFAYSNYEGHPIRNIIIKKVSVFGTDINDSTKRPYLLVDRIGNKLHVNTRDFVIRNNILVKKGDRVNPYQLAYNEHIIRELSFIQDVKFDLERVGFMSDSVDLVVHTKDIWSLGVNYEPWALNQHRFTISQQNLLGLGRTWSSKVFIKEHNAIGFRNKYTIDNLYGLFLNIDFEVENSYDRKYSGISFDRSGLNPGVKWLMGGGIKKVELDDNVIFKHELHTNYHLDLENYDAWLAYVKKNNDNKNKSVNANAIYALRASYNDYQPIYQDIADYNRYVKNTTIFGSITLQEQQFFHTRLVSTYDRTEDIPFGRLFSIIGGVQNSKLGLRPYFGIRLAKGSIVRQWYTGGDFQFGGFHRKNELEQGLMKYELSCMSPLSEKKKMKYRQFLKLTFTSGIDRLGYDSISLNESGVRGMNSSFAWGTKRLTLNSETVFFLNRKVLSFKFAFFTFGDLGLISSDRLLEARNMYSSIGLGLRIRNENLLFKTIQLQFAWYPHHPSDMSSFNFVVRGIERWPFNQFGFTPPAAVDFN